jgi:hypothetical protein
VDEQPTNLSRAEFWQRAAAVAFGLWAIMIPIGVAVIRESISELVKHDREQSEQFNTYMLQMERRITLIEERQQRVLTMLSEHDRRLDGNGKR